MNLPDEVIERIKAHIAHSKVERRPTLTPEQADEVADAYMDGSPEAIVAIRAKYLPKEEG